MSINEAHARLKANVWKAIAQSQLDVSALPKDTLESLVDVMADAALLEVDATLGKELFDTQTEPAPEQEQEGEQSLWEGRPFLSISKHYRVTNQRIRITEGILSKKRVDIELVKIQDINQKQTISERMINVGDLTIRSNDRTNPLIILDNIADVQHVHEVLREAVLEAKKRANFSYREEM